MSQRLHLAQSTNRQYHTKKGNMKSPIVEITCMNIQTAFPIMVVFCILNEQSLS